MFRVFSNMRNFETALRSLQISQSKSVYIGEIESFSPKLMVLPDIYMYM